jgi:hypothetical protein
MKATLSAFIIALLLILDQMRTGGYYRTEALFAVEQAAASMVRVFGGARPSRATPSGPETKVGERK